MLNHIIFLEAEHWTINFILAATQNTVRLALVTTPLRMTAVICSVDIHSTGTSMPPRHPFAPTLYCMMLPRNKISHTFVALVTLDTTHLYFEPSSHSKRALADWRHCLSVSSSKKNEKVRNVELASKAWTILLQACIWQTSEERAANTHSPSSLPASQSLVLGFPLPP